MHLHDPDARNLIAAERIRRLRGEPRPDSIPVGATRRRLGALLVSAGARLEGRIDAPVRPSTATSGQRHPAR
jgi:hypothetical protein